MLTLGHLSDWHTTNPRGASLSELMGKRFSGWLSWNLRRHRVHRPEVLRALFDDLKRQAPDHVAVTGDLTNVALEREFGEASQLLRELGSAQWVSLIPGNHDAYVAIESERSWDRWAEYLASDSAPDRSRAPRQEDFPTLRIRGELAIVGLCSALPTPVFRATGELGAAQIERLEALLLELRERDLCRVVLVHHSPAEAEHSARRRLIDSAPLREVLGRAGAELVLHGHGHRTATARLPGPEAEIPVVGVRSASYSGGEPEKRAQYHLYRIERAPSASGRFRIGWLTRSWHEAARGFVPESERSL